MGTTIRAIMIPTIAAVFIIIIIVTTDIHDLDAGVKTFGVRQTIPAAVAAAAPSQDQQHKLKMA